MRRVLERLHDDQGGNVLVLFVSSALLLAALVWMVAAVGQRIVQHRTMQTAADATALEAAATKARGLNAIAHLNVSLAASYAVWAAHRIALAAAQGSGRDAVLIGNDEARLVNAMDAAADSARSVASLYGQLAVTESAKTGEHDEYRRVSRTGRVLATSWPATRPLAISAPRAIPLGGLCSPDHGGGASPELCRLDLLAAPLVLRPDWGLHRFSRGYALLTATGQSSRRATIGSARGSRPIGAAPVADRMLGTAQAETFSAGGHGDLWHADFSARLVPYQAIEDAGDASGLDGDAAEVLRAVRATESSAAYRELRGRWARH
ncbi:MAG TPA: hypothetical protein VMZ28_05705 [Kofleriaceae bacterium]|nr:hypothetical protein [Kofleriaceae bacterium]